MPEDQTRLHETLETLEERCSELECLYVLDQILTDLEGMHDDGLRQIAMLIPTGWRHPDMCQARIILGDSSFESPGFRASSSLIRTPIIVHGKSVGTIEIGCTRPTVRSSKRALPPEKQRLVETIARRAAQYVSLCRLMHRAKSREPTTGKGQTRGTDTHTRPPTPAPTKGAGGESRTYTGLCATCDNRETCTYPKPEGGIWHCEEFR